MRLSESDWLAIEREFCARKLANFIQRAWPVVEPSTRYVHGWHIDAIAEHLEAVTAGEINRLLINVPPGTMKSLAVGVLWPAWEWGPRAQPQLRYVGAAHAQDLAVRDNMRMRRLVKSEWYQRLWPLGLAADQDAKLKFENAATGYRAAVAATAMTGHRGDRVLYDDPHSVEGALSDVQRTTVLRVFSETVTTRLNSPERSAIVVVMQRLHEQDLVRATSSSASSATSTSACRWSSRRIAAASPRSASAIRGARTASCCSPSASRPRSSRATSGRWASSAPPGSSSSAPPRAAAACSRPTASCWSTSRRRATEIAASIRYWDKAGTKDAGAYTAGVLLHRLKDGRFCVAHCRRGQWNALDREREIRQIAELDGKRIRDRRRAGARLRRQGECRDDHPNLAGWRVTADRPSGDKVVRAEPYAAQVQGGNVLVVKGAWTQDFIDEHVSFPVGRCKDQVDAAAAGFNFLTLARTARRWCRSEALSESAGYEADIDGMIGDARPM